jgi:glycosyltransferase involved in cell wall biosynthesis
MRGLVTIIIPARDAARTIQRAIASVLAQDYRPIEVIVVDDSSSDTTLSLISQIADPALRLIRLPRPRGAAAARNAGIEAASGEIVAFQDADDEWLPGKLARQMRLLRSDPRLTVVACAASFVSPAGKELGLLFDGKSPPEGPRAWPALLARNTIATPTVMTWRHHLLALGGFDERLMVAEDQDMWIRLAMRGHVGYLAVPLVRVHAVPNSLSSVGGPDSFRQQLEFTLPMVERHVAAKRAELSPREIRLILRERWGRLGRAGYSYGYYRVGLRLIARAALLGFEPLGTVRFLIGAAPPVGWLKRLIRAKLA